MMFLMTLKYFDRIFNSTELSQMLSDKFSDGYIIFDT